MTTKPEEKAMKPIDEFRAIVTGDKMKKEFQSALPDHIPVDKFLRTMITAVQMNLDLLIANRQSLYTACMMAAQDGLMVDGKEAVINVYNTNVGTKESPKWEKRCKYMPMTYGILKKVRNSGELASLHPDVVYTKDTFEYYIDGEGAHLKHTPSFDLDRGTPRLTYAVAKTKDGAIYVEVLTEAQIQSIKKVSKSSGSGPWSSEFADEMRKKSAIRRLSKRLPMSTDIESVIRRDDDLYDLEQPQQPAQECPKKSRLESLIETDKNDNVSSTADVSTKKEPENEESGKEDSSKDNTPL